jgi:hypothetical protein
VRRVLPLLALAGLSAAATWGLGGVDPAPRDAVHAVTPAPEPDPDREGPGEYIDLEHPERLASLYAALARAEAGEGRAHLAFWGGSHTAGDLYTGRMRDLLQARFGDLGHGYAPLAPVATNHWARGVVIDPAEGFEAQQVGFKRREVDRYGPAGVRFVGYEDSAFAAVTSDHWGGGTFAEDIQLLYDDIPGGGTFDVWLDGRFTVRLRTDAEVPRPRLWRTRVSDGPHRLEVRVVGDAEVHLFGVRFEREGPGLLLHNLGLVGGKARHQLLWDAEHQWAFVDGLDLDLVAFAYGNNESDDPHLTYDEHERHLDEALRRLLDRQPEASCLLLGPTDRSRRGEDGELEAHPAVVPLTELTRRVADANGCAFFDTLRFQGGSGSGVRWLEEGYGGVDLKHLTARGYRRWARVLTDALLHGYEQWSRRPREPIPSP